MAGDVTLLGSFQELLEAMGLPVIRAEGEAEALCAQLTRPGGGADFAVTADSDSFLHGATAVIKTLQVDYKVGNKYPSCLICGP